MKKECNGLDLLKFMMALMVIMIHVKPNGHSVLLESIFTPLMSIAVPVFFLISSVFIFNKLHFFGGRQTLKKWCERLSVLYVAWLFIDSWFIIFRKNYFVQGFHEGIWDFIKDVFLGSTFPGSWFLSALVMSVIIVYSLTRIIHPYIILLFGLSISLYVRFVEYLPEQYQIFYDWYSLHIRKEVNLSFPSHMIWISMGQIIAIKLNLIESNKKILFPLSIIVSIMCYMLTQFNIAFIIYVFVVAVFIMAYLLELPTNAIYKRIRNYSILMFLFHFSIAGKMDLFCSYFGNSLLTNWLFYILVVLISIVFAEMILRLEKYNKLNFLKYTH